MGVVCPSDSIEGCTVEGGEGAAVEGVEASDQVTGCARAALDGGGGEVASWSAVQGAEGGAVEVAATERRQRNGGARRGRGRRRG